MEAGSDGVEDGASKSPPRSAALALGGPGVGAGGGFEEVVGASSHRPPSTASAFNTPVSSGGSGGGGPGRRLRDVGTEGFDQHVVVVVEGHGEETAAGSSAEFRARLEPRLDRLSGGSGGCGPGRRLRDVGTEGFDQHVVVAEDHGEETAAGSSAEFRARLEPRLGRLPVRSGTLYTQIHEIRSFVIDNPSYLTELPSLLSGIGLNIIDAHAFSRKDRYALNDFIVECWPIEDAKGLDKVLVALMLINKMQGLWSGFSSSSTNLLLPFHTDDCESDINAALLNIGEKVTSGSCGVMFHGTYSGAKIAFGILSLAYLDQNAWSKLTKEISTSRDAHHANIARLPGPCTKPCQFIMFTCTVISFLGLLLSQFGRGHRCTCFASVFTACAAICTIAFVDYSLCKCLPEGILYKLLFGLHFALMVVGIVYVWSTYIKVPQLPTIKWRRDPPPYVHVEPKDESKVPLLQVHVV